MVGEIIFDPLMPLNLLGGLALVALFLIVYATWARLLGWWLRGLSLVALLGAIANPSLQNEDRQPLSDIVLAVVDESASQRIGARVDQNGAALAALEAEIAARQNTELRVKRLGDGENDSGTALMKALGEAMAQEPQGRVAGAVLITDGQLHDPQSAPALPAPLHVLLTGQPDDWDRRLIVKNAPGFAIIGEKVELTLRVENQGAVPQGEEGPVRVEVAVDGTPAGEAAFRPGVDVTVPIALGHGGMNVIQFQIRAGETELTDRNNSAVIQINGVRDRLRVLLVSGEPHPGERTWRNLLKSDSAVDLVHFTILRPPEKQDGVPVSELSLIAFPTRELFLEKVDEFDLIIFDRYHRRGILPAQYLANVGDYVRRGGAVLIAAGPGFGAAESLYRSPLAAVIPAIPTSRVIEEGYSPAITDIGQRHPVSRGLEAFAPAGGWGRWFRLIEIEAVSGNTVMTGLGDRPLLVLDRVGEGRVAMLASDHAWLWSRGYEGGGPQLELLRRLAHWMMKEPDLEEEALTPTAEGQTIAITRRTLGKEVGEVEVTGPDGQVLVLPLDEKQPGVFQAVFEAPDIGLYRFGEGDLESVIAVGPSSPREFEETIATGEKLTGIVGVSGGGILRLSDGIPDVRNVRPGRKAAGRGWIGITPREAYRTKDIRIVPLLPPLAFLLLAAGLMIGAWLLEGRRTGRA